MTPQQTNLLKLYARSPQTDGWTVISTTLLGLWREYVPQELYEEKKEDDVKYVRLTEKGQTLLEYMP